MSRTATITRATKETDLTVELALDGTGDAVDRKSTRLNSSHIL